ncbi:Cobyrinic acid ac-diamide synthase [Thalassoporum mexicanum PCC 7367]|uniref:ParA family protein n=1 Tax=Thalassoporum mexicanum TaxID=3457544 RepID=UPI00029FE351|nr:AAA family ATPase [Pseudanabaena sp. PCC 7367]AFY69195.1 Cobyrinic acid ac-diamide synthase [Pseudanabaena sp. PCC 7367]
MGYVIASVNMKGGVGKTTLTVNIATCLAKLHRKRVLVVDLDTQISATLSMISPAEFAKLRKEKMTLRQLVRQSIHPVDRRFAIQNIIQPHVCKVQGLDLLPGDIDLYDEYIVSETVHKQALQELNKEAGEKSFEQVWDEFEQNLVKNILAPIVNSYDYVILDCAPGYNLLTRSSLLASDYYLLPAKPEPLSLVGIQLLERRIERMRTKYQNTNSVNIQLLGIVFSMSGFLFMRRYYKQVIKRVSEDYSAAQIFATRVPNDVDIAKAIDNYRPVVVDSPGSNGAKAFMNLTKEFLQKLNTSTGMKEQTSKMSLVDLE